MEIGFMKEYLISRYPNSLTWKYKVNNMKDNQIISIYYSMLNREQKHESKNKKKIKLQSSDKYHQITIAEYLATEENKAIEKEKLESEQYHQITIGEYLKSIKNTL